MEDRRNRKDKKNKKDEKDEFKFSQFAHRRLCASDGIFVGGKPAEIHFDNFNGCLPSPASAF